MLFEVLMLPGHLVAFEYSSCLYEYGNIIRRHILIIMLSRKVFVNKFSNYSNLITDACYIYFLFF